jgi:hypothetical protein
MSPREDIDAGVARARAAADRLEAAGRTQIGRLAFAAFEVAQKDLIHSAEISPVLHAGVVMDAAAQASIGDGLSVFDATVLCVVAPSHDMCLAQAEWALAPKETELGFPSADSESGSRSETGATRFRSPN